MRGIPGRMDLVGQTVRVARALADGTRVRIVAALAVRNLCVCELTALLGAGQPLVSRHLGVLRAAGLVEDVRSGRWVEYRLARGGPALSASVLDCVAERAPHDPALRALTDAARTVDRLQLQGAPRHRRSAAPRTGRRRDAAQEAPMRIEIHVYGPGCAKCRESAKAAEDFLAARGLEGAVVKHTSIDEMTARGVLATPAVYVGDERIVSGRVLRKKDLEAWMAAHPDAVR